jgi:hypothetical protein
MTPTNLGDLPSNLPFPNQRVQIKRGAVATDQSVSNQIAAGTKLNDGQGGLMEIFYQPRYPCYWLVRGNLICKARADQDNNWRRCDWGLYISPADALGVTLGHSRPTNNYPTLEWRTCSFSYMFKLNAGITYNAYLAFQYSTGYWQVYHTNYMWHRIFGVVIGEGEI